MKRVLLISILFLVIIQIQGQEINSYDFDVKIDVKSQKMHVKCEVDIDFNDKDSISLVLWKNTNIHSITSNQKSNNYNFDTLSVSPINFVPDGKCLTIYKREGKSKQKIEFDYECNMQDLNGWARSLSKEWIELNIYSGWFPVYWSNKNFKSKIKLLIDDDYLVTGSGLVEKKDDYWEINQSWLSYDNVIIASKDLKTKTYEENNVKIDIVYSKLSETDVDSTLLECNYVSNYYQKLFGENDRTYLKLVIIPYMQGGYGRPNFVTLRTKKYNMYTKSGIAHEMAHFWWINAKTTIWEDWLNEAFAEYSMLMYLRERLGLETFNAKIDEYRKHAQGTPPIWGIDRNCREAYVVLYEKGSVILYELEMMIGDERFINFLRSILENKIDTTDKLLKLVEEELSGEVRNWLEEQLKK